MEWTGRWLDNLNHSYHRCVGIKRKKGSGEMRRIEESLGKERSREGERKGKMAGTKKGEGGEKGVKGR